MTFSTVTRGSVPCRLSQGSRGRASPDGLRPGLEPSEVPRAFPGRDDGPPGHVILERDQVEPVCPKQRVHLLETDFGSTRASLRLVPLGRRVGGLPRRRGLLAFCGDPRGPVPEQGCWPQAPCPGSHDPAPVHTLASVGKMGPVREPWSVSSRDEPQREWGELLEADEPPASSANFLPACGEGQ